MKTIEEIMGLVEKFGDACETFGDYQGHENALNCVKAKSAIESALRELVERKPLSEERIWEIESDSYVASRKPEYTKDSWGDEKTIWHETKSFSFPLFARNIERAHGIGA